RSRLRGHAIRRRARGRATRRRGHRRARVRGGRRPVEGCRPRSRPPARRARPCRQGRARRRRGHRRALALIARKSARLPGPFTMRGGGLLPEVDIVYETWGALAPARDNAVLILTGLSPAAHAALEPIGLRRLRAVVGPSLGGMTALAYAIQFPGDVRDLVTISSATRATPFATAIRSLQRECIRSDPGWRGGDYPPEHPPETGLRLARKLGLITYRSAQEWRERFGRERITAPVPANEAFGPEFEIEA